MTLWFCWYRELTCNAAKTEAGTQNCRAALDICNRVLGVLVYLALADYLCGSLIISSNRLLSLGTGSRASCTPSHDRSRPINAVEARSTRHAGSNPQHDIDARASCQ